MAAVVNVLQFKEAPDAELFEQAAAELGPKMHEVDGFERLAIVRTGETEIVLLIEAATVDALDQIATDIGSPWMRENVVPLLAGPPQRHIGDVIASA